MDHATPTRKIYDDLLAETPPAIHDTLRRADDLLTALAWIRHGTRPEGAASDGTHPQRRFLTSTGTDGDKRRWAEWEKERYSDGIEDIMDLTGAGGIHKTTIVSNVDMDEPTPFHYAMARSLNENGDNEELETETIPAGTLYAVIETPPGRGPWIYRGLYRLRKNLNASETPQPGRDERVWLNGTAERMLARVLT